MQKRVMSVMRLLSSKADVIKAFSKRFNELEGSLLEIGFRVIQDHIVTMLQALAHYEKVVSEIPFELLGSNKY